MINHDFHCRKCNAVFEVQFETFAQFRREVACEATDIYGEPCGGIATQTWTRAPALAGVWEPGQRGINRTFTPGAYDVQAGRVFHDRSERDAYLKRRGLVACGPEEFSRQQTFPTEDPEPDLSKLPEAMEAAYQENVAGKVTPHLVTNQDLKPLIAK